MSLGNSTIPGEASESDSEDEINTISESNIKVQSDPMTAHKNPQGRIVAGEAPESDEELGDGGSVSSAASVSSITSLTSAIRGRSSTSPVPSLSKKPARIKPVDEIKYKTLLHRKLRERNISLWRNVTELVYLTATQASRDLNIADQQLLKSQGVLQETAAQLRSVTNNVESLREKLNVLTATPFLPHITIPPSQ